MELTPEEARQLGALLSKHQKGRHNKPLTPKQHEARVRQGRRGAKIRWSKPGNEKDREETGRQQRERMKARRERIEQLEAEVARLKQQAKAHAA
jgi:uncharacterized protein YceH (UPF0502 family)